jgi:hypothetical protein
VPQKCAAAFFDFQKSAKFKRSPEGPKFAEIRRNSPKFAEIRPNLVTLFATQLLFVIAAKMQRLIKNAKKSFLDGGNRGG